MLTAKEVLKKLEEVKDFIDMDAKAYYMLGGNKIPVAGVYIDEDGDLIFEDG